MKLVQVAEQNAKYYSPDFVQGFNAGAKAQYEADSKERRGRWVLITKDGIVPAEFLCSVCGRKISYSGVKDMVSIHYPYCHCGAKMDEVSE